MRTKTEKYYSILTFNYNGFITLQKAIEINWLQDINIIKCTAQFPYISATNSLMNTCHMLLLSFFHNIIIQKIISELTSIIKNLLLQNNKISVSIVKKLY